MKIIAHIQKHAEEPAYKVNEQIQELYLVLVAQIRYIQEEHSALVVAGSYSDKAHSIYRNKQKNVSAYNPISVEALKSAVTLAALPEPQNQYRQKAGGPYSGRGGYRFAAPRFNHFSRGRGRGFQGQQDFTPGFQPRPVPGDCQLSQE